jgi:hypothetical protein
MQGFMVMNVKNAVFCDVTLVALVRTTWCHIPENSFNGLHIHLMGSWVGHSQSTHSQ